MGNMGDFVASCKQLQQSVVTFYAPLANISYCCRGLLDYCLYAATKSPIWRAEHIAMLSISQYIHACYMTPNSL